MKKILIQPTIDTYQDYLDFAKKEDFDFEIVDFAFPQILNAGSDQVLESYLQKDSRERFLSMHGAFIDLYINSPDSAIKASSQERIHQGLEIAYKLGVKFVVFHTNALPMMGSADYYKKWVKEHINFWKAVTEKYNLTILLENMWDKHPTNLAEVIEGVDSPKLKICFDTGHHNVFSESSLEEWFTLLGKHISYIHFNDNKGDRDSELSIGGGTVDWRKLSGLIKKYCQTPYVVLELKNLEMVRESLKFMRSKKIYPFI